MNKLFHDQNQNVYIKVLSDPTRAGRECVGAAVFSQFVDVPVSLALDSKVILVNKVSGITSDSIPDSILNAKILDLLTKVSSEFVGPVIKRFSTEKVVRELELKFTHQSKLLKLLAKIKLKINRLKLVPIHGDLQKQNILFSNSGELILIDFEHFCFGPAELELANSLFHQDTNCLDAESLVPRLVERGIVSIQLLSDMLTLYALKEIAQGLNPKLAFEKLGSGQARLRLIQPYVGLVCLERSKPDSVLRQLSI